MLSSASLLVSELVECNNGVAASATRGSIEEKERERKGGAEEKGNL